MHLDYSLKLIAENEDYLIFDKPRGFRTHKVSENQLGLVEVLSEKLQKPLWVTHRLDKETSGLMIFAKNKNTAQTFFERFETKSVKKTYLFLTNHKHEKIEFSVQSHIEKSEHSFINSPNKPTNSETEFKFLKKVGHFNLWEAKPITGKPHQIRLHAELAGIPILGDNDHGGSPWFRLALHAHQLEFDEKSYVSEPTAAFAFEDHVSELFLELNDSWDALHKIYHLPHDSSYRLIHQSRNQIQADVYNHVLWVYWYKDQAPTENDLKSIRDFSLEKKLDYVVRWMKNRGTGVSHNSQDNLWFSNPDLNEWTAKELDVNFKLQLSAGYSPGLFLDQRSNRSWVQKNAAGKKILNLFSYTSLFSVYAALGKAEQVTTVDVSANFLNWSRENFKLNHLEAEKYEFFSQDSLLFLKGSIKRGRKWDLIICDPPSFGRSKDSVWKIEKDLPELASLLMECLAPSGKILFTCNYEEWNMTELKSKFSSKLKKKPQFQALPAPGFDFDLPDDFSNLTKGFIVLK